MRIYVACLAAYNNGKLHGEWIDATLGADHIKEEIKKVLSTSPENNQPYPCEEWAIHDYDGFPSSLGENPNIEELCEIAEFITEHGDLGEALIEHFCGDLKDAQQAIEDQHQGEFANEEDFAIYWTNEVMCSEIPKYFEHYIDYERMARDFFINDFFSVDVGSKIHVFSHA